ncbi:MAG TPA: TIGR00282 family metallophosphoesterase [Candidatus Ornithomonoglobus intestinigallinarum]|uniref:TIGR00282 family metallophosphoesterase n=1 Tax=Candidatus Ornithomonoglobus intestinigallinarum TaxID=2840894 RepID=A0A9D1H4G7_9FIRM|nr:TIGR00282 family metallophosphoesterase [Candidatus Ornithomonoglobus intestinigallinarum]
MRIFCIGDVVSAAGRDMLFKHIEDLKYKKNIDLCIANGENASHGHGMARASYLEMCRAGVDGFTMGNHTWNTKEIIPILENEENVIRPINFHPSCPGSGAMILTSKSGARIGVINTAGRVFMDQCHVSPFEITAEKAAELKKKTDAVIVDFHAEATSEKQAMGYFLDGLAGAVFGTHTHVQTADERILPKGTGYITDLGMTGPAESVLGMNYEVIVNRFVTGMPQKFEIAAGTAQLNGCIFELDDKTGLCTGIERVFIRNDR